MYHYKPKILRQSFTDGKVVVNILQKKLRQMSNRNTANSLCPFKSKSEVDRAQIESKSYIQNCVNISDTSIRSLNGSCC